MSVLKSIRDMRMRAFRLVVVVCITLLAATASSETPSRVELLPGLYLLKGCVNTAVFERNGRALLIDPGELTSTPAGLPIEWVLVTHHHRDQASGAGKLVAAGAKLVVPTAEERFFVNAEGFWRDQQHYWNRFHPHRFTQRESVPVAKAVKQGDVLEWEGLAIRAIETPGHTNGSVTYLVDIDGRRVAFTGDLIFGPGQLWEMHSLQNRYGALQTPHLGFGALGTSVFESLARVLDEKPDLLVPSHGVVMFEPRAAVAELKTNFDAVMDNYLTTVGWPNFGQSRHNPLRTYDGVLEKLYPEKNLPRLPRLPPVLYPPWIIDVAWTTQAIVADNGSAFLSDCGTSGSIKVVERIREVAAAKNFRVEGVWPTHYHLDHNEQINALRQATGAAVYVQREMADITEHPFAYGLPYSCSEPIRIDHVMEDGQSIDWHGIKLTFYHFPGQTLYHAGLLAEKDGFKAFFTGDSWANWGLEDYCTHFRCFLGEGRGYDKCLKLLLKLKPNILVQAHRGPTAVTEEYLRKTLEVFERREELCRKLLPYDDPNFGLDPYWIRAYPYRQAATPGTAIELEARITNHATKAKEITVELRAPENWRIEDQVISTTVAPRSDRSLRFRVLAPKLPDARRHVLGFAVAVDGRSYGELAEAIVDIGPSR